jgi:hypothetical protein
MNNQMIMNTRETRLDVVLNTVATGVRRPLLWLTSYYMRVLERNVSPRQTLLLVNAQLAFLATVLPAECPVLLRLMALAWLVGALLKCKEAL